MMEAQQECHEDGPHILMVDEDGFDSRRLTAELRGLGCTVTEQACLELAHRVLHSGRADFAVLNPMLGGASWYRFLHSIRDAVPERWMVLTGSPSTAMATESMKLGACATVSKPISGAELLLIWRNTFVPAPFRGGVDLSLARVEWEHMHNVIQLCNGNMSAAARALRIPRQTLYNRLRKAPTFTKP